MRKEIEDFVNLLTDFAVDNMPPELSRPSIQMMVFPGRPPTFSIKYDFVMSEEDVKAAKDILVGNPPLELVKP